MSKISKCHECGGNIVEPAYEGDGAYPVPPMCSCNESRTAPRVIEYDDNSWMHTPRLFTKRGR